MVCNRCGCGSGKPSKPAAKPKAASKGKAKPKKK
jgi:hypothetical protein